MALLTPVDPFMNYIALPLEIQLKSRLSFVFCSINDREHRPMRPSRWKKLDISTKMTIKKPKKYEIKKQTKKLKRKQSQFHGYFSFPFDAINSTNATRPVQPIKPTKQKKTKITKPPFQSFQTNSSPNKVKKKKKKKRKKKSFFYSTEIRTTAARCRCPTTRNCRLQSKTE